VNAIRDEKGRFKAGNKASTGRKSIADELPYVEQLKQNVSAEQFGKIIAKLIEIALRGNLDAAKILLPYLLGNPVSKTELTGAEGNTLEIIVRYAENN
jgi:hypothetical protein